MRWKPDEQLIDAVRTGRCSQTYADLTPPDRAWVVAGLSAEGFTAEKIAVLLSCSLRTVRVVKADPLAVVCLSYMTEAATFSAEVRLLRSELSRMTTEANQATASASRLRTALARVTASRIATGLCSKGLHDMSPYNVYTDPHGRRWCRECHRDRQAEHRARRRILVRT